MYIIMHSNLLLELLGVIVLLEIARSKCQNHSKPLLVYKITIVDDEIPIHCYLNQLYKSPNRWFSPLYQYPHFTPILHPIFPFIAAYHRPCHVHMTSLPWVGDWQAILSSKLLVQGMVIYGNIPINPEIQMCSPSICSINFSHMFTFHYDWRWVISPGHKVVPPHDR